MKVITGHLTATDKKAVKAILDADLLEGRVKDRNYFISKAGNVYSVKIQKKDRGLIPVPGSPLRISTYTSTFII